MANEWYYTLNGQQQPAPATAAQLKQLATSGQLKPDDLIWQDGMPSWAPASSVKGLFTGDGKDGRSSSGERLVTTEKPLARSKAARKAPPVTVQEDKEGEGESEDEEPGMPPVLVPILSLCTGGLFGLWYIYRVCSSHRRRFAGRATDASGRPLGRVRHPVGVLVLSYLTMGYYTCYWTSRALRECADYTGRKDINPRTELALMLVFPPYALFVAVLRLPELIRAAQAQANLPPAGVLEHASLFVNPFLFLGLPLLVAAYQDVLNRVWQNSP